MPGEDFAEEAIRGIYASSYFQSPIARRWTQFLILKKNSDPTAVTRAEFEAWLHDNTFDYEMPAANTY